MLESKLLFSAIIPPPVTAEDRKRSAFLCVEIRKCRECGCTDRRACVTDAGPCWWVEADLCSACEKAAGEAVPA